jgi:hypothetical protein
MRRRIHRDRRRRLQCSSSRFPTFRLSFYPAFYPGCRRHSTQVIPQARLMPSICLVPPQRSRESKPEPRVVVAPRSPDLRDRDSGNPHTPWAPAPNPPARRCRRRRGEGGQPTNYDSRPSPAGFILCQSKSAPPYAAAWARHPWAPHPWTDNRNGCSNASAIQRRKRAASAPSIRR